MNITNTAAKIDANFDISNFTKDTLNIYAQINHKKFDSIIDVPFYWDKCIKVILDCHKSESTINSINKKIDYTLENNNKVVIAFSGGLDSCYQSLKLREEGYEVILLHVCNLNRYTNGQEKKVATEFANKYNFPIELVNFKAVNKDKYWQENSIKTCLCYAICMDYCVENSIKNISSGDDLRLSINEAVVGVNLGDSKEITLEYFKNLPFNFIPIKVQDKASRLKLLNKYNAQDDYYSCVTAGRLNQYLHNKNEEKYNVKLDKYSCGISCRKCAMHCLQEHYFLDKQYPEEYINKCWNQVAKGPDEYFFGKHLSLEKRIQNLLEY